ETLVHLRGIAQLTFAYQAFGGGDVGFRCARRPHISRGAAGEQHQQNEQQGEAATAAHSRLHQPWTYMHDRNLAVATQELIIVSRQRRPRSEIEAGRGNSPAPSVRGVLYVVATPIGNLGDLSARAREVLLTCDLVAAEDTRHFGHLLQSAGIAKRTLSAHEHNEAQRVAEILATLDAGKSVALVSDAGTPLISDPGYRIVQSVARAGHEVRAVPGPCAAIAALSIAGLPTDRFVFEGFLPAKVAARRARLSELAADARTLVFYEAPHRLQETLAEMGESLGPEREAAVAREITKAFETVYRGTLGTLAERAQADA